MKFFIVFIGKSCNLAILQFCNRKRGFTFLEILITMGIAAIIGFSVTASYLGYYNRRQLDNDVQNVISTLRNAQSRAISLEGEQNWGVRFVNNTTSPDYYVLFNGPSYASGTVVLTKYLSRAAIFGYPVSSSSLDVIFAQISGAATFNPAGTQYVTLWLASNTSTARQINIDSNGLVTLVTDLGPAPGVTLATPASRGSGAVSQSIVVKGTGFIATPSVSFGAGIIVNNTIFNSSTQLTVSITIAEGATLGTRDVTVTNSESQPGTCSACFTVNAGPTTASTSPVSMAQDSTGDVVVKGTGYASGASSAFSGDGITVNNTTFNSSTQVTANITVASSASVTARDITVTNSTDAGAGTGVGIFSVTAIVNVAYETAGAGTNASGGGACAAASAWEHTEICVQVPSGTPGGSQPTKARSNSLDSNTGAFTVQ